MSLKTSFFSVAAVFSGIAVSSLALMQAHHASVTLGLLVQFLIGPLLIMLLVPKDGRSLRLKLSAAIPFLAGLVGLSGVARLAAERYLDWTHVPVSNATLIYDSTKSLIYLLVFALLMFIAKSSQRGAEQ
jgi:hypothetical protein